MVLMFLTEILKYFLPRGVLFPMDSFTVTILTCIMQCGWGSVQYIHWRILHGHTLFSCCVRCLLWTFSEQFSLAHATCWKGQDSKWICSKNKTKKRFGYWFLTLLEKLKIIKPIIFMSWLLHVGTWVMSVNLLFQQTKTITYVDIVVYWHSSKYALVYLLVPQLPSPSTAIIWTSDRHRENLPFCCFIGENVLRNNHSNISPTSPRSRWVNF